MTRAISLGDGLNAACSRRAHHKCNADLFRRRRRCDLRVGMYNSLNADWRNEQR